MLQKTIAGCIWFKAIDKKNELLIITQNKAHHYTL